MNKFKKLATQWSTYRGLFLVAGAAGLAPAMAAVEAVDGLLLAGTAVIGAYDTLKDKDD